MFKVFPFLSWWMRTNWMSLVCILQHCCHVGHSRTLRMKPWLSRSVLSKYCSCYFFLTNSPVNFVVSLNKHEWKVSFLSSIIIIVPSLFWWFTHIFIAALIMILHLHIKSHWVKISLWIFSVSYNFGLNYNYIHPMLFTFNYKFCNKLYFLWKSWSFLLEYNLLKYFYFSVTILYSLDHIYPIPTC